MTHRILVLSPHTDDAEFGCGGTIAKLNQDNEVYHLAFSTIYATQNESVKYTLEKECSLSGGILGCKRVEIFDYDMREFPNQRQEILYELIRWKNKLVPSIVFLPSSHDTHQDHEVIRQEGFRAFKDSTILGYEVPWNNLSFNTQAFTPLTETQMETKIRAIDCYTSQKTNYNYFDEEYIRSLARARGKQVGVKYAEAFEVIRWIL